MVLKHVKTYYFLHLFLGDTNGTTPSLALHHRAAFNPATQRRWGKGLAFGSQKEAEKGMKPGWYRMMPPSDVNVGL